MLGGIDKNFLVPRVSFFIDLKATSKNLFQNRLFNTTTVKVL